MLKTTEKLLELGFKNQVIKDWNIASIFNNTRASRYALINKALTKEEIIQLCRGVYVLSPKYRDAILSKFYIASRMVSGSYISFETALSYHGYIPEKVSVVMSAITKGRTKSFDTPLGEFQYIKITVNEYEFLSGVLRVEPDTANKTPYLIASPLRALSDMVYFRKIEWTGLDFILEGMRIEMESLETLTSNDFDEILPVYSSKRVISFLKKLRKALGK